MEVYVVRLRGEGYLYRDDALMVYFDEGDARADADDDAEVGAVPAQAITAKLEDGELENVRLVLEPSEHYSVGLKGWRRLAAKLN